VQHGDAIVYSSDWDVSILTRPEGRVQLFPLQADSYLRRVSILTRPEGRVQPRDARIW